MPPPSFADHSKNRFGGREVRPPRVVTSEYVGLDVGIWTCGSGSSDRAADAKTYKKSSFQNNGKLLNCFLFL